MEPPGHPPTAPVLVILNVKACLAPGCRWRGPAACGGAGLAPELL